ncbi:MAG: hypothetical protein NVS9B4_18890 [Candidatus Acidiferrum sp.]
MKSPANKTKSGLARCNYSTPSGRPCRLPVRDVQSPRCSYHSTIRNADFDPEDLSSALTDKLSEFKSPSDINALLSRLLLLLAQNRITARRAAVLAYISNLLLRTIEEQPEIPPRIICDIPHYTDNPASIIPSAHSTTYEPSADPIAAAPHSAPSPWHFGSVPSREKFPPRP